MLQTPAEAEHGRSGYADRWAKALKRKPREIAEQLAAGMQLPTLVASVSVEVPAISTSASTAARAAEHFRSVMMPPLHPASA